MLSVTRRFQSFTFQAKIQTKEVQLKYKELNLHRKCNQEGKKALSSFPGTLTVTLGPNLPACVRNLLILLDTSLCINLWQ